MMKVKVLTLFTLSATLASIHVAAQSPAIQNTTRPLEQRFEQSELNANAVSATAAIHAITAAAPEGAENITFTLQNVSLEGMSALSINEISHVYQKDIGQTISLAKLFEYAAQITALYRQRGFILSRAIVPVQTIASGSIQLHIIEGFIDDVVVQGVKGVRPALFDHYKQQILKSKPLHIDVLERYQLLANDLGGVNFKSVLSPSQTTPGAATLLMTAELNPMDGLMLLDNRGSDYSGPWQWLLSVNASHLFNRLETTRFRYATVPGTTEELQYWQLSHTQILSGEGLSMTFDYSRNDMQPGGELFRALELRSKGDSTRLSLSYPLIRSRAMTLNISGGIKQRKYESEQLSLTSLDDYTMAFINVEFQRADAWGLGGVTDLQMNVNHGVGWGSPVIASRQGANTNFQILGFQISRSQSLSDTSSLNVRVSGQHSSDVLPSAEEFGLGGEYTVRGYDPSEWTGEKAWVASVEWRRALPFKDKNAQAYVFYDSGWVKRQFPTLGQPGKKEIAAYGIGLRGNINDRIAYNIEMTDPRDTNFNDENRSWQAYGRLLWRF